MGILEGKTIWCSGGTGSFGQKFVEIALKQKPKKIIIFSRDEFKQLLMKKRFGQTGYEGYKGDVLRFHLGDVRSRWAIERSMKDVDYVIHAAALKQIDSGEYSPLEFIATNIDGTANVTEAATNKNVKKLIALTTDKAVSPCNLYGCTKATMERVVTNANVHPNCAFILVRYGNVANSRGSLIQIINERQEQGFSIFPVTDYRMTRFWITLEEAVNFTLRALEEGQGGETWIPKMPSYKITDLVEVLCGACWEEVGKRPGEKLHEDLITEWDDCYDCGDYWVVYPSVMWQRHEKRGRKVKEGFKLTTNNNDWWLTKKDLQERLKGI